ncbi:MAG: tRNA pseudouridine(55) synthase TruB [Parachlamydiaceae bacterium]|nr:tRNA pseudouridine(55) synthase TruB [Parachlamydiaceae bacterium]
MKSTSPAHTQGYLLVNKPKGKTAFTLVAALRKRLGVKTIGHAGTLDPLATGVMVMLIGREYTKLSDKFLGQDKEYVDTIHLGIETDSYDSEGQELSRSELVPTQEAVEAALQAFQGEISQIPPMFSAKKINGQKLYHLARQGKTVERAPVTLTVKTELIAYNYPYVEIRVNCSKGTYIRSIAQDLGKMLGCGGHLCVLSRTRSGNFHLSECIDGELVYTPDADVWPHIRQQISWD